MHAVGHRLVSDARAESASPRFDNSQMDGFAVDAASLASLPGSLAVGPTVSAGVDPDEVVPEGVSGRAIPVMTGAKLPRGTAAIVPVEKCTPGLFDAADEAGEVSVPTTTAGAFIRAAGSGIAAGAVIAPAGSVVDPIALAALINAGVETVTIQHAPRVLIVTGGKEVGGRGGASIPDSNGPMLHALCKAYGLHPVGLVHTDDDPEKLAADLDRAVAEENPDVIITSGGISHGRFEVIRIVLENEQSWFGHVAQQPGGPQGLSTFAGVPVICLPGNPVSTMVSFRVFVAPVLGQAPKETAARLDHELAGLVDGRTQWRRGQYWADEAGQLWVRALGGPGSHLISQAVGANCLIEVGPGVAYGRSEVVKILPLAAG